MTSPHDQDPASQQVYWDPVTSTYQQLSEGPGAPVGGEPPVARTGEMPTIQRYPASVAAQAPHREQQPYANGTQQSPVQGPSRYPARQTPVQGPSPYPDQQPPTQVPSQPMNQPIDPRYWSDPAAVGQVAAPPDNPVSPQPGGQWGNGSGQYGGPPVDPAGYAVPSQEAYSGPAPATNGQVPIQAWGPHDNPSIPPPGYAEVPAAPATNGHPGQPQHGYGTQAYPAGPPETYSLPPGVPAMPVGEQPAVPQGWYEGPPTTRPSNYPAPPAPTAPTEQWVYVDPNAFSNPYTESPVYTSGPQPVAAPAPPVHYAPQSPSPGAPVFAGDVAHQSLPAPPSIPEQGLDPRAAGDPSVRDDYRPEQGELGIKERRAWKTWQLLVAVGVAAVLGMAINAWAGNGSSSSAGASSSGSGAYKLPPPSGSVTTTAPANSSGSGSSSSSTGSSTKAKTGASKSSSSGAAAVTTTTAAGGATTGASTTTSSVVVGPATVLVPEVQQTGDWTSPAFTIAGGTWNIGWAFQCTPAPSAPPSFQIFAVASGAAAGSTPAVTSSAASGNSITPLTSTGSQQIIVQTTAACRWAVKVTGSST